MLELDILISSLVLNLKNKMQSNIATSELENIIFLRDVMARPIYGCDKYLGTWGTIT
jgi:hypothetical protein